MKTHLILQYISKLFLISKKSYFLISLSISAIFTPFINRLKEKLNDDNLSDLSVFFVVLGLAYFMTLVDTFFGVLASKHKGANFSSDKFGNFIAKLVSLLIYTIVGSIIILLLSNSYFLMVVIYGILMLVIINEFVSIGENIEKRFKKKPYMFTLIDKVFEILELRFIKIIEEKLSLKNNDISEEEFSSEE